MLQIAAVFVRLPDLFFQLFAALILIDQLLRQQLAALSGFAQVLQCGGGFHLHSLGDILRYQRHSGQPKWGVRFLGGPRIFRQDSYLHHWLFSLLSVQLELQFPNPVLSFPQLLPSPPLALFGLSLQVWQLLGALLQGELQLLYSAAQVFIFLRQQTTSVGVSPSVENHPTTTFPVPLTFMSMVLDCEGMADSCCRRPWVTLRFCFRLSFSADRHRTRFSESVAPWATKTLHSASWWEIKCGIPGAGSVFYNQSALNTNVLNNLWR